MLSGHKFACVLAARAGSERLKNKNLRKCAGKPLWQWTKEAVEAAGIFDDKLITTDIDALGKPFIGAGWVWTGRKDRLATDDAHISDVMREIMAIEAMHPVYFDFYCLVSPTNPLRTGNHIRDAAKLMLKEEADAVVAVAPCHPETQNLRLQEDETLSTLYGASCGASIHGRKQCYHLTGSIVIAKTELWSRKARIYNDPNIKTVGYVMPKWDIDIDTKDDLFMAEAMLQCLRKRRTSLKSSIKSVIRARRSRKSHE